VIAYVNVNIDKGPYNDIEPVAEPDEITVLLNKHFALPSDWSPSDFVDIGSGHLMREEAATHFILMREAMREVNLNLVVVVTYRSFSTQRNHFNNALARSGRAVAEGSNARPGHSEHQTGLAVDVLHRGHDGGLMVNQGFERSRQLEWLVENAHNYGFILRYPNNYRNISGFIYEPWHWRYVSVPVATAMHERGIVLFEEFYGRYLVQGVVDKVNAYILHQQALANAEKAAEEAAAEAAEAAETARVAGEAMEAARMAAETAETARMAAEAEGAAADAAASAAAEEDAEEVETPPERGLFLEGFALFGIIVAVIVLYVFSRRKEL